MIKLINGEQLLSESQDKSVILTSHRICLHETSQGHMYRQHIMLEHVTSTEITKSSNTILLAVAIIITTLAIFFFAVGEANDTQSTGMLIISLVMFLLYYFSRKKTVIFSSPSTKMKIIVNQMSNEAVFDFVNNVEQAIVDSKK